MEKVINQIYWNSVANTYMAGTKFKKHADKSIEFENKLMAPGLSMVTWSSTYNYQAVKRVPELPLLINGHHYQIYLEATSEPAGTVINRLTFYNAQRDEIKHLDFDGLHYDFIFPAEAVSYTFTMLNAGCQKINFQRMQIADQELSGKIFNDIYFTDPSNYQRGTTLNLVLVMDNPYARKVWSKLEKYAGSLPFVVVNISWQGRQKAGLAIKKWLAEHQITNFRLISTNQKLNSLIPDIFINRFNVEYYDNRALQRTDSFMQKDRAWYSEDTCDPDWLAIFNFLRQKARR